MVKVGDDAFYFVHNLYHSKAKNYYGDEDAISALKSQYSNWCDKYEEIDEFCKMLTGTSRYEAIDKKDANDTSQQERAINMCRGEMQDSQGRPFYTKNIMKMFDPSDRDYYDGNLQIRNRFFAPTKGCAIQSCVFNNKYILTLPNQTTLTFNTPEDLQNSDYGKSNPAINIEQICDINNNN